MKLRRTTCCAVVAVALLPAVLAVSEGHNQAPGSLPAAPQQSHRSSRKELGGTGAAAPGSAPTFSTTAAADNVPRWGSRVDDATMALTLDLHNRARMAHATPNLTWNSVAAAWAQKFADGCWWGHDPNDAYVGNIALVYPDWAAAFATWYDHELPLYNYAAPGYSDATGHFTALLWKATTGVGCASSWCTNTVVDSRAWTGEYFVCYYYPPGNVDSIQAFRDNVLPLAQP